MFFCDCSRMIVSTHQKRGSKKPQTHDPCPTPGHGLFGGGVHKRGTLGQKMKIPKTVPNRLLGANKGGPKGVHGVEKRKAPKPSRIEFWQQTTCFGKILGGRKPPDSSSGGVRRGEGMLGVGNGGPKGARGFKKRGGISSIHGNNSRVWNHLVESLPTPNPTQGWDWGSQKRGGAEARRVGG